ncbi:MAG: NAD(P)/FAD-dependent oxidoreductase [Bacteroidota bacterium]
MPGTPKTPLLSHLLKAMQKAMHAAANNIPASEIEGYSKERRKFIADAMKVAAVAGVAGVAAGCSKALEIVSPAAASAATGPGSDGKIAPRIAIVGGGIAGLHAAYTLKQKGRIAQVYEASNRTGGRMYTAQNVMGAGLTTELGGEFIDSGHKDMLQLAHTFGLRLLDTRAPSETALQQQVYYFNGIHYTDQQVINEFSLYANRIRADIHSLSNIIDVDHYSASDAFLDNISIAGYFDLLGMNGWLRQMLDVAYVTEYGQPIDQQTALNFLFLISPKVKNGRFEIFGDSDERYKIAGGNQQICDRLAQAVDGQVNLGHELLAINQNANGSYDVSFKVDNTTTTITCDVLLLTLPFTLLRNVSIQPLWPAWKQKAIFDIGYGNNSKLILGFNNRFWRNLGYAGYYFTESILQSGWDSSQLQPPVNGSLTIYTGAQASLDIGQGDITQQVNNNLPLLNQMYPGATAQYNNKAERFVWPDFKWTKASYTCFKPGQYTSIAGNEIKPVGNIFFAGEHCSYNFQGYMNGGAETGRRAAEAILKIA